MDLFRLRLIHTDKVKELSRHHHTFINIQERKSYKRERERKKNLRVGNTESKTGWVGGIFMHMVVKVRVLLSTSTL